MAISLHGRAGFHTCLDLPNLKAHELERWQQVHLWILLKIRVGDLRTLQEKRYAWGP